MADNGDKPATKSDIARLDQKIDRLDQKLDQNISRLDGNISRLDQKIDRVVVEVVKTQSDIREIKHDMATKMATKDDINRILNAIDAFAKKSESDHGAVVLHGQVLTEVQVDLKNHEQRLKTLESARP